MDKRMRGDGSVRRVLVTMPAALHRTLKELAVQSERTLDEVVVGMLSIPHGRGAEPMLMPKGLTIIPHGRGAEPK